MKVNSILYHPSSVNNLKKNNHKGHLLDFKTLLENADKKISPLSSSLSIPSMELEEINQIRSLGVKTSEEVLNLLEDYQKAMANHQIPLDRIEPLIQSLSKGVSQLQILTDRVPASDPLRKILTDVGIISAVEIERYYRGGY